jgi:hypothetical protein
MKASITYENKVYELNFKEIAPSIYVYKNALPPEMAIIDKVERALNNKNPPLE